MILECFTASTIYGITPLMEKYILKFIEIESFIILNGLLVFLFCATYWIFFHKNRMWKDIETVKNSPTLIVLLALTSFLIYIVANFFYMYVIKHHKTYLVTAIIASYPIVTVILGYLLFNEDITLTHMLGVFFVIGGIVLLNLPM